MRYQSGYVFLALTYRYIQRSLLGVLNTTYVVLVYANPLSVLNNGNSIANTLAFMQYCVKPRSCSIVLSHPCQI